LHNEILYTKRLGLKKITKLVKVVSYTKQLAEEHLLVKDAHGND
jgi:hypothetical protein